MDRQQGLKDALILRSSTNLSPVPGAMKDDLHETDYTLTGAETGGETTGTGVKCEKVTVIVIGTGASTEITIAQTGIVCLLTAVTTGTGSLSVAGSELPTTPESVIVTGVLTITTTITTDPERTGNVSAEDTVIPTTRTHIAAGGGSRTVEIPEG